MGQVEQPAVEEPAPVQQPHGAGEPPPPTGVGGSAAKGPSQPPTKSSPLKDDPFSRDLEKDGGGGKRRRSSGESALGKQRRQQTLVPNTPGRIVFLGLFVLLLVASILETIGTISTVPMWKGLVITFLTIAGFLYLAGVATTPSLFRLRLTNFVVFCGVSLGLVALEAVNMIGAGKVPILLHVGAIISALLFLVIGIILVLPSTVSAASNLHPMIPKGRSHSKSHPTTSKSPDGRGTSESEKHRRQLKMMHYEDWPDPIPFPARALYSFQTASTSELPFKKGDPLVVTECRGNWWQARHTESGQTGFIPSNFVQALPKAHVVKRYLASTEDEVSVQEGQTVELLEHHEFASLIRTVEGTIGSIPTECLDPIIDPAMEKLKI